VDRLVLGVLDDLVVVHAHLERAAPAIGRLDLAVDDEALPAREDAGEIGLAEPDRAEKAGGVSQGDEERDLGAATRRRAHAGDGPRAGAGLGANRQPAQRGELAPVLMTIREVQQGVGHRDQAQLFKQLGALGAHALDELKRRIDAGGPRRGRGRGGYRALPPHGQSVASLSGPML
jgi:hypothetical protein